MSKILWKNSKIFNVKTTIAVFITCPPLKKEYFPLIMPLSFTPETQAKLEAMHCPEALARSLKVIEDADKKMEQAEDLDTVEALIDQTFAAIRFNCAWADADNVTPEQKGQRFAALWGAAVEVSSHHYQRIQQLLEQK